MGETRAATIADHTVPLAEDGVDDESNLQPVCADCHTIKTAEESNRGIRRDW